MVVDAPGAQILFGTTKKAGAPSRRAALRKTCSPSTMPSRDAVRFKTIILNAKPINRGCFRLAVVRSGCAPSRRRLTRSVRPGRQQPARPRRRLTRPGGCCLTRPNSGGELRHFVANIGGSSTRRATWARAAVSRRAAASRAATRFAPPRTSSSWSATAAARTRPRARASQRAATARAALGPVLAEAGVDVAHRGGRSLSWRGGPGGSLGECSRAVGRARAQRARRGTARAVTGVGVLGERRRDVGRRRVGSAPCERGRCTPASCAWTGTSGPEVGRAACAGAPRARR